MRRLALIVLASTILPLAATARQAEPAQPPAQEPKAEQPAQTAAQPPAKPLEPPQITVLEPGAEPRQALRLAPAANLVQAAQMRMHMDMSVKTGDGEPQSAPMPPVLLTMTMSVKSVSPEGDITYDVTISDCHVEPTSETPDGLVNVMNSGLAPMNRLTGTGTMSNRGFNKALKFTFPEDIAGDALAAMSGLSDQVGQMSSPLPEEPVGAGARWQVKARIRNQGIEVDQTTIYTLKEVRGGAAILDVAIEQSCGKQALSGPGMPEGYSMEVESLSSKGTGTSELPLTMLMPSLASAKVKTDMALNIKQGEQVTTMKQDITLDMTWKNAEPKAAPTEPANTEPAKPAPAETPKG